MRLMQRYRQLKHQNRYKKSKRQKRQALAEIRGEVAPVTLESRQEDRIAVEQDILDKQLLSGEINKEEYDRRVQFVNMRFGKISEQEYEQFRTLQKARQEEKTLEVVRKLKIPPHDVSPEARRQPKETIKYQAILRSKKFLDTCITN